MSMDCAADFSIVIPYASMRVPMGTEVISFIPYPLMRALMEMMIPIAMILPVDLSLYTGLEISIYVDESRVDDFSSSFFSDSI